jgi:ribonuclease HI
VVATTENDEEQSVEVGGQMASPPTKKQKSAAATDGDEEVSAPGWDPLPADAEDGFDTRITLDQKSGKLRYKNQDEAEATKLKARVDPAADMLFVYTDGACRGNGQTGAIAGVGVFFGRNDPR